MLVDEAATRDRPTQCGKPLRDDRACNGRAGHPYPCGYWIGPDTPSYDAALWKASVRMGLTLPGVG